MKNWHGTSAVIFLFSPIDLRTLRLHFLKVSQKSSLQCDGVSSGREKALRLEVQQDCTVCVQNCSLHCSCSGVAFHTTGKRVCLPEVWEGSASAGDWTSPPSSQSQSSKRQSYLDFGSKSQIPEVYPIYFLNRVCFWTRLLGGIFFEICEDGSIYKRRAISCISWWMSSRDHRGIKISLPLMQQIY